MTRELMDPETKVKRAYERNMRLNRRLRALEEELKKLYADPSRPSGSPTIAKLRAENAELKIINAALKEQLLATGLYTGGKQ